MDTLTRDGGAKCPITIMAESPWSFEINEDGNLVLWLTAETAGYLETVGASAAAAIRRHVVGAEAK